MNLKQSTVLIATLLLASVFAADKLTVKQLAQDPKKVDGKVITLIGKVDKFEQRTSKAGNDYFLFKLLDKLDKKATVNVYGQGKADKGLKNGDVVEIKGEYKIERKYGSRTYKNELQVKPEAIKVIEPAKH